MEGHGSLLPDGRVIYYRWEYIDRNFGNAQGLWTANPDGTSHAVYYGNNTPAGGVVLFPRAIPGTELVLCVLELLPRPPVGRAGDPRSAARPGRPGPDPPHLAGQRHQLVSDPGAPNGGFDSFTAVSPKYEDPYPLSDKYFLCSRMTGKGEQMGIYLVDVFGNEILLHTEGAGCFNPMPLGPHPRPPIIASRRDYNNSDGYVYVQNVYQGTHMKGVKPGSVKFLRVVESPEKRFWTEPGWNGQGIERPGMNWHDFNNKRILGTVPVEADGSASFALPVGQVRLFPTARPERHDDPVHAQRHDGPVRRTGRLCRLPRRAPHRAACPERPDPAGSETRAQPAGGLARPAPHVQLSGRRSSPSSTSIASAATTSARMPARSSTSRATAA